MHGHSNENGYLSLRLKYDKYVTAKSSVKEMEYKNLIGVLKNDT